MNIRQVGEKHIDIHQKKGIRFKVRKKDVEPTKDHARDKKRFWGRQLFKAAGYESAKKVADQMDGGEEVQQASMLMYEVSRPLTSVANRSNDIIKQSLVEQKRKKYKVVTPSSEPMHKQSQIVSMKGTKTVAKSTSKKAVIEGGEKTVKEAAKKVTKESAKAVAKTASRTAGTVAGTATTGAAGILIGQAAGEVASVAIEYKDMKSTVKQRKIKFFLDKMKAENEQKDSVVKVVRDVFLSKAKFYGGKVAIAILGLLGGLIGGIILVAVPVVLIVSILYNSPFALFMPQLTDGDTVQLMTNTYVSEFISEVESLAQDHTGYDEGEICYMDPDGNVIVPSPQMDIMCVYMVEYGIGDAAVVMNDRGKRRLANVFDDMCSYTTSDRTEIRKNEKGKEYEVQILEVNVVIKDYQDMIREYRFSQEQIEMIEQMMNY